MIEGEILVANAIRSHHARLQADLHIAIASALRTMGGALRTYVAPSVKMGDKSMPEPDIIIAPATTLDFVPLSSMRLALEISDPTLAYDLKRKAVLYARHGIISAQMGNGLS